MFFFRSTPGRAEHRSLKRSLGKFRIPNRASRFIRSESGNVAMIFGLTIVPFLAFAGLSVDFAAASREKAKIQAALDAAVLAAGRQYQDADAGEDAVQLAKDAAALFFTRQTGYSLTENSVDPETFELVVRSQEAIPTSFMGLMGSQYDTLTVNAVAKAGLARGRNDLKTEVSLMLDVTGSMAGSRMTDLKAAASDLVNILVDDGNQDTRVALAPFSHAVNVGSYFQNFTNKTPVNGNTCVVERDNDNIYKDKKPNNNNGYFEVYKKPDNSSSSMRCTSAEIVPLTSDKQLLLDEIDDLPTYGATAGHIGTQWAWYLVSKRWHNKFPEERAPTNDLTNVQKIVVLMSDGVYNRYWHSSDNSDEQARKICNKMKQDGNGITVYSVGFALTAGSAPYNRLKDCASGDANFFAAEDGDQLRAAFMAIAFKISNLRLTE